MVNLPGRPRKRIRMKGEPVTICRRQFGTKVYIDTETSFVIDRAQKKTGVKAGL
jgi:hypothetical protein